MKDFTANTERVLLTLERHGDVTVGRDRHRKICPAHKVSVRARNSAGYVWTDSGAPRYSSRPAELGQRAGGTNIARTAK